MRQEAVREEERAFIAREIHDELGQVLTVSKIQLSLLVNKLFPGQQKMKDEFKPVMQLIDRAVDSVQQISAKLRPGILDELGLAAAIEWQTKDFAERTGITFRSSLLKGDLNISKDKETAVFRIYQEALTNAARHAQAERVSTFMREENGILILEIIDNGRGITKGQMEDHRSFGILGMKERAKILGGKVTINGVPGQGTSLKVEIPLD
jgi:signal transduction histidine kinase